VVTLESLGAPVIGELQRLALGDGRELVQFPVGTKQGMGEYTLGVLAIIGRKGASFACSISRKRQLTCRGA
jgi:hypothetical protein